METKAEKFQRLAGKRLPAAVKQIELIGNLAASQYESSPQERRALVEALDAAVADVAKAFKVDRICRPDLQKPEPTGFVEAKPQPDLPKPAPDLLTPSAAIDGRDRKDIRAAVKRMHDGDVRGGVSALHKVILGWPV